MRVQSNDFSMTFAWKKVFHKMRSANNFFSFPFSVWEKEKKFKTICNLNKSIKQVKEKQQNRIKNIFEV